MSDQSDRIHGSSRFHRTKTTPMYWYNKATDLRGAAGLVWTGMEEAEPSAISTKLGLGSGFAFRVACWPVYLMLCGLALELLLKTIIVAQGRKPNPHHKLADLWHEAGLSATRAQRGLLHILTESVYWAGRYPAPLEEADFDRFAGLQYEYLWDLAPTATGKLRVRRRNANLTWTSFNKLWSVAHASPALDLLFDRDVQRPSSGRPNHSGSSRRRASASELLPPKP